MKNTIRYWLDSQDNKYKPYLDTFIIILIILSVVTTLIQNTPIHIQFDGQLNMVESLITVVFCIEYSLRFYVSSDFYKDMKDENGSLKNAINKKIMWFVKPLNLIDLLALIPAIRFFRLFRILRLMRVFKQSSSIMLAIRTYKQETRVFIILLLTVLSIVLINSFLTFLLSDSSSGLSSYFQHVVYHLKLLNFATDDKKDVLSNVIASVTLLVNITFIAIFISLITTKMEVVMNNIKQGHLGKINLTRHIVLCGLSACSEKVIKELLTYKKHDNIVLVTEKENPDIAGIIYYYGDYSDIKVLQNVNIKDAKMCIVFAEMQEHDTIKSVDLRTVLTVFNIEQENKDIHSIAEIMNQENGDIIRDKVMGDEIIYKETIDANMICNCIRHPHISPMIYDFLNIDNHTLEEARISDFGFKEPCSYKELKLISVDREITLLGIIDKANQSVLSPKNAQVVTQDDRLLFIA